ncbi:MAG TPA: glycine cleavage system aminomethyltransferase GcvT, partial [Chloroflexota bacterium]|nr:glycine cleavage system aminomethyltransferase GcvT [Chloroflexota bacterium]
MSDEALRRTPLAAVHERLGARMAPFSGWLMPIQYTGIVAEHLHTREAASLFDLSHMGRLRIDGSDGGTMVQRATTNDASRLAPGAAQYSLLCNERGGVIEDLIVYRMGAWWLLVVNAGNRERVFAHLASLGERAELDASLRDDTFDLALIGLQGPASEAVLREVVDADLPALRYYHAAECHLRTNATPVTVARTGYTGEDGFEIMVPTPEAAALWEMLEADARVRPAGLGARDTLRLEAGMPLYGHELTEDVTPFEAGLGRVVRLGKGPFVGSDALAALAEVPPSRRLVGLALQEGAIPRAGCAVERDGRPVGAVTSGTFSPTLRRPIALAYVESDAAEVDTELSVVVRGGGCPARVVSL